MIGVSALDSPEYSTGMNSQFKLGLEDRSEINLHEEREIIYWENYYAAESEERDRILEKKAVQSLM